MAEPVVAIVGAGPAGVRAAETLAARRREADPVRRGRAAGRPDLPPAAEGRRTRRGRAVRARGGEGRRDPPRAAGPRRPGRLPAADARLEHLPEPARSPWAGRLRRAALRPADPGDRGDGSGAPFPGLDAARRVHARRGPDRAQGAGHVHRPSRRAGRRRAAAAARRASICQGRRADRRRARCDAFRCKDHAAARDDRGAGDAREGGLVHGPKPHAGSAHPLRGARHPGRGPERRSRRSSIATPRAPSTASIATRSAPHSASSAKRSSPILPAAPSPSIR